jgi:serine/threonine-protein kinase
MMVTPAVRLLRPLGEGGMGSVWVADHLALHTQVVVKFIAKELAGSPEALARFSREAAAASQVKSPHVVQTFDHGVTEGGRPYIVMELLEGRDLATAIGARGRLSPTEVLHVVTHLTRALDRAHARGIVHRDIKPENIFLCETGDNEPFVKLLDFGIAKGVDVPRLDGNTKTGSAVGTPYYMSPEQLLGAKDVDHRTDIWAVGVVAFEALTGQRPFDADTVGGLAVKVHEEPRPKLSTLRPELGAALDAWFAKACARSVADRFASAKELADALAEAVKAQPHPASIIPISGAAPRVHDASALAETAMEARASTDAGLERSRASSRGGRGKLLFAAAAVCAVLGVATLTVPRLLKTSLATEPVAPDPRPALAENATPTSTLPLTPTSTPTPTASASATSTASASATSTAGAVSADGVKTTTARGGRGGRPTPSASASAATSPPPTASGKPVNGNDIF